MTASNQPLNFAKIERVKMILKVFFVAFLAFSCASLSFAAPTTAAPQECDTRKTLSGGCCVFPFTYRGKKYYDCTDKNSNNEWCATTSDYDANTNQWGECDKAPAPIFDVILETNKNESTSRAFLASGVQLFQGDIVVDAGIRNYLNSRGLTTGSGRTKRAVMRSERARWMSGGKGVVPYRIESSNRHARGVIERAMRHWESKVPCLKFKPWTGRGSYLSFFSGGGCYSMVGRQRTSGAQKISIGRGCEQLGVVAHEIGHALGFWHEQSRPDRDRYVTINWGNIQQGVSYNFHKYDTNKINSRGISYDYNSIMHYSSTAFAKRRGVYTIVGKDGRKNLGQRYGLSEKDVQQANLLYCGSGPRPQTPRPPRPPTPPPPGCAFTDQKYWCPYWKSRGLCTSGPTVQYMQRHCQKSCKCSSGKTCQDKDRKCPRWYKLNYCTDKRYSRYVKTYCKKSCRLC